MGAIISYVLSLLVGGAPAPIRSADYEIRDPSTGLTGKQRLLIRSLWALVVPDLKQHGIRFFVRLFTEFPGTQDQFSHFKGKDPATLADNKRMAAHATTVMSSIATLVDNLDDVETMLCLLHKIAQNHHRRKTPIGSFDDLRIVFVAYMGDNLGNRWSSEAEEAFNIMMTTVNTVLQSEYAKLDREQESSLAA